VRLLFEEVNNVMQKAGIKLTKWESSELSLLNTDASHSDEFVKVLRVLGNLKRMNLRSMLQILQVL